ncbi:hypothetical protein BFM98_12855 [Lysinibacillus sp. AR18-8]|uniref:hypothetical protein n=1 Tax=Lysinibacillus sp. AR18-8 TaxID=1889781 RepID=UPI0008269C77|nr:hypothetical protein [Lysinibacillus sp. AR18-8]OCX63608.1 hypothetical protein BFM98_12855 [Lysinibacillus sp. AR18-8]
MDIRAWLGGNNHHGNGQIHEKINELSQLYVTAVKEYFSLDDIGTDFNEFCVIIKNKKIKADQEGFREWFLDKGSLFLKDLIKKQYKDCEKAIAKMDYEMYILSDELDMEYPDDLVASLISITEEVPTYLIENVTETKINLDWNYKINKINISYVHNDEILATIEVNNRVAKPITGYYTKDEEVFKPSLEYNNWSDFHGFRTDILDLKAKKEPSYSFEGSFFL